MKPRPSSIRALLLLVLLIGLPLGILRERQTRYRRIAVEHDRAAGPARGVIYFFDENGERQTPAKIREMAESSRHIFLKNKYRMAASQPWLPVPADPPPVNFWPTRPQR